MSCDNQFRHVCLKDLDNYIKRDTYFSDFSKEEIKQIQENLGIVTKDDWNTDYNPTILSGTYEQIHNQQILGNLKPGFIYVITNYRTIYYDCDNVICGTDDNQPSQEYWIFLKPISTNMFDKRVSLFQQAGTSMCSKWIVEYDININDTPKSTGKITYLKDQNNNSAYYDFKNLKFKKKLAELNKGPLSFSTDTYLYTFDNGGEDMSEYTCKNNHLNVNAYNNVFLGLTVNVKLDTDCHNNIFFKNAENSTFLFGTYNNYFKNNVSYCYGVVHDKELSELTSITSTKHFEQLGDRQIVTYIDSETLTNQIKDI